MTTALKIDFVSDVACPWCAIGLSSLELALARLGPEFQVQIHPQPFQLNPHMAPEGEDITEHLGHKYGMTVLQVQESRATLAERGRAVGFEFGFGQRARARTWNTFDAHRLLHWASLQDPSGAQALALKRALLAANFTEGSNVSDHTVLLGCVRQAGLDEAAAAEVLRAQSFTDEVQAQMRMYTEAGIQSVPSVIVNDRHLIQGGQPPEVFEQALRDIAAGR